VFVKNQWKFKPSLIICWNVRIAIVKSLFVAMVFFILIGCAKDPINRSQNDHSGISEESSCPSKFIHQIATADHIIITNRLAIRPYEGFCLTISGHEIEKVILAISTAKVLPYEFSGGTYSWQLQFFRQTNLLGIANWEGSVVMIDREYYDESGVLDKLSKSVMEKSDYLWRKEP